MSKEIMEAMGEISPRAKSIIEARSMSEIAESLLSGTIQTENGRKTLAEQLLEEAIANERASGMDFKKILQLQEIASYGKKNSSTKEKGSKTNETDEALKEMAGK